LGAVRDQREVPAQFDNGGQLAALVQRAMNGFDGGFVDGEHVGDMGGRRGAASWR
jgi:hypothetical protein